MKPVLIMVMCLLWACMLFSTIDRTITIDTQLMQQLRLNKISSTCTDPYINFLLSNVRNETDPEPPLVSDTRAIDFPSDIKDYAKKAMYDAIDYDPSDPNYPALMVEIQDLINSITGTPSNPEKYVYIKPSTMTSANQSVNGQNPGSIVQLIFNTSNNYSFCPSLPFNPNLLSANPVLDDYNRVYYASNGLTFVSFIYDMLYYEMNTTQRANIQNNIEILSGYLYNYLQSPSTIGLSPDWRQDYTPFWATGVQGGEIEWINGDGKINLLGSRPLETLSALGYSRIVLGYTPGVGGDAILNWVISMFQSVQIQEDMVGYLDYITKDDGGYVGGADYSTQALKGPTQIFFTALYRQCGVNLWNDTHITKWLESLADNLTPRYYDIPTEDCWWDADDGIDRGLMEYYYQNNDEGDIDVKNKIKWYLYRKKYASGHWPNTKDGQITNCGFTVIYSFNPNNNVFITDDTYAPESSYTGVFSNDDYTQLSVPKSSTQTFEINDYKERLWLHVIHENSYEEENFHSGMEKGHFRVFYKQKQFIIDTGYHATYRDFDDLNYNGVFDAGDVKMGGFWRTQRWFGSGYSANMILVNPDINIESAYIQQNYSAEAFPDDNIAPIYAIRPVSGTQWNYYTGKENMVDQCHKEFLTSNNQIRHLKMNININALPSAGQSASFTSPVSDVKSIISRNFYTLGSDAIVIFDNIDGQTTQGNNYRNQLHFNPDAVMTYDAVNGVGEGKFSATMGSDKLYGAMGSLTNSSTKRIDGMKTNGYNIDDTLFPHGLPTGGDGYITFDSQTSDQTLNQKSHPRVRVEVANTIDNNFFTLLLPSSNSNNPITEVHDTNHSYITFANLGTNNVLYCGVQDSGSETINDTQITTNADMFLVQANDNISSMMRLIVNEGNNISLRDVSGTRYGTVNIFNSTQTNFEEMVAEWTDGKLYVTCKSDENISPVYKILRSGVSPENFYSRTNATPNPVFTWPANQFTGCNFSKLAYDDNYFYVNYSISGLGHEGVLDNDLYIYYGDYTSNTVPSLLQFKGQNISFSGSWSVPSGNTLVLSPAAVINCYPDFGISISGTMNVSGVEENPASLIGRNDLGYGYINVQSGGKLNVSYGSITYAKAINVYGWISCDYGIISNLGEGINLYNPGKHAISHTEISGCGLWGVYYESCSGLVTVSYLKNCTLSDNQYGLHIHNSSPVIENTIISDSYVTGILVDNNSYPYITGCKVVDSYNHITNQDSPELIFYPSSSANLYNNDIIFDDFESIWCNDSQLPKYTCPNNYWGTVNQTSIDGSFVPTNWNVNFVPILTQPVYGTKSDSFIPITLLDDAILLEMNDEPGQARDIYTSIIETTPDSLAAKVAAARLLSCSMDDDEMNETKVYLGIISAQYPESDLVETAYLDSVLCDRKLGNYNAAIRGYESKLEDATTYIDSLMLQLDIVYTYIEAQADTNRAAVVSFIYKGVSVNNLQHALDIENDLMEDLLANVVATTGYNTDETPNLPITSSNFPNPFNPFTTIKYHLPFDSKVQVEIFNSKGQKVKSLINESQKAGRHSTVWDGKDSTGKRAASGIYFYRITSPKMNISKKLLLLK